MLIQITGNYVCMYVCVCACLCVRACMCMHVLDVIFNARAPTEISSKIVKHITNNIGIIYP
jgi:hypothetical protein